MCEDERSKSRIEKVSTLGIRKENAKSSQIKKGIMSRDANRQEKMYGPETGTKNSVTDI